MYRPKSLAGLVLPLCLQAIGVAQVSNNTTLLGTANQFSNYNDIWGYTDGTREYALIGTGTGTAFYNVTQPQSPNLVGFIPGPNSTWRDMKTYSHYAYIVTEGGGGMQIVDLANPEQPTLLQTWGTARWRNAHNIQIDTQTGVAYVVGTNNGMVVVNLASNPANPTFIANWRESYLHDIHVQHGLGHACAINEGLYKILDVSNPANIQTISAVRTPGHATHASWVDAQDQVAALADETSNGHLSLWDISDPVHPALIAEYNARQGSIIHNVFVRDSIVHCSYYTEGYRAVDISDPTRPTEVGYYDTWPGTGGGFDGLWGCYPYTNSGAIYLSDRTTGLYIVQLDVPQASHVPLQDTQDERGPYRVSVNAQASTPISSVEVAFHVGSGPTLTVPMLATGTPDEYAGDIPGIDAPARCSYSIRIHHGNGTLELGRDVPYTFRVGKERRLYFEDFESGDGGFTHSSTFGRDDWQFGTPQGQGGDPLGAFSGTSAFGTDLGLAGGDGLYSSNSTQTLLSPTIPIPRMDEMYLRFHRWLRVEESSADQALVTINGYPLWTNTTYAPVLDDHWVAQSIPLSFLSTLFTSIQVGFSIQSDGSTQLGGWNVDDVEIFFLSDCVDPVPYGQATAGTGNTEPRIAATTASLGNPSFVMEGHDFVGSAPTFLLLGIAPSAIPFGGMTFLVDPTASIPLPALASGMPGQAGDGHTSLALPIPNDLAYDGLWLYFQWVALDAGAAGGFSSTEGLEVRLCRFGG